MNENNATTPDNIIVEVLEDGTIYQFDMNVCEEAAVEVLDTLWQKEGNEINFDYTATVYSLFLASSQILLESGWDIEELIEELRLTDSDEEDIDD